MNSIPDLAICGFILCLITITPIFGLIMWLIISEHSKSIKYERQMRIIEVETVREFWQEKINEYKRSY
jgi:hypothetical protein